MSARRGSSRSVGVVRQCAVYLRGGLRCVWCCRRLRAPRTDGYNHAPTNLLPSCRTCNSVRNWPEVWPIHLGGHGQTAAGGAARAAAQLAAPLDYESGRALAHRWHPGRLEQIRACDQRYRARRAGRLPPAHEFLPAEENAA